MPKIAVTRIEKWAAAARKRAGAAGAVLLLVFSGAVGGQSADPSTLPRLQQSDLSYVGAFKVPDTGSNGGWFGFGGGVLAFNPAKNSLFASCGTECKGLHSLIAEISIPTPVNGAIADLPRAVYLQPFTDVTEGRLSVVGTEGVDLDGLLVVGDRLIGTARIYYDANNTQAVSHYARSVNLSTPSFSGWSRVWEARRTGFVSGFLAAVPPEWQAKLGGPQLTGQCCIPIVSRTSAGPAAFSFDASKIGQPVVPATPLLHYGDGHSKLGAWEGSNPTYGAATLMGGLAVIAGTRTVLYVGTNGLGPHCYGDGTADKAKADGVHLCYDPTTSDKGSHAYPYRYQVWAYDLNDLAAVKAGKKKPWDVVPYGVWPISFPHSDAIVRIGGVTYDAAKQLIYVAQQLAEGRASGYLPLIHVFKLNVPSTPPVPLPPPAPTAHLRK